MKRVQKTIAGTVGKRPVSSILNSSFAYSPSHQTDISATFKRIREQQAADDVSNSQERREKVRQLGRSK